MSSEICLSKEELLLLAADVRKELISNGVNDTFNPTLYCHEDSEPDDENYAISIELIHQWKKVGVAFFFVEGEWGKRASEYIIGDVFYSKEELDNYTSLGGWDVILRT